jgi:hypothetical protein
MPYMMLIIIQIYLSDMGKIVRSTQGTPVTQGTSHDCISSLKENFHGTNIPGDIQEDRTRRKGGINYPRPLATFPFGIMIIEIVLRLISF